MAADHLPKAYQRLIEAGLIGRSVHRYKSAKLEQEFEAGFQDWLPETVLPDAVIRWTKEIGDGTNSD